MEPSTSDPIEDSLDSFFMSLAVGPDGKTLETGLLHSSWDAAKTMQDGITQSNPKLFSRGFEAHVDRVLHGIEPKNEDSCKEEEEEEEERESKFLHRFGAKERDRDNEDVSENINLPSCLEAEEEETYKIDLEGIIGWVLDE